MSRQNDNMLGSGFGTDQNRNEITLLCTVNPNTSGTYCTSTVGNLIASPRVLDVDDRVIPGLCVAWTTVGGSERFNGPSRVLSSNIGERTDRFPFTRFPFTDLVQVRYYSCCDRRSSPVRVAFRLENLPVAFWYPLYKYSFGFAAESTESYPLSSLDGHTVQHKHTYIARPTWRPPLYSPHPLSVRLNHPHQDIVL
jgi:hypothetical protein